ncbi:plastocyanin [Geodermatophilus tzadiensis]|uniref:Plastocyanin n=1 Tax=Geodermatophilus tzadiensis TaxID=1137988 RepID=A0A2T0TSP3_9ACTN|nr:cupredoxin domain-containing protein [Geodermatophilus tzadiensis]PRY48679.1 plastocyanin [Geodermatophilus tzadiensis]
MPRPTRRSAALVLALGLGLLSGCSDDGGTSADAATASSHAEGEHSESPSASASGEATPSSSAAGGSAAPESAAPTSEAAPPVEAQTVTATEGEMFIELSQDSFSPGEVTIEVVNEGNATHDLVVERDGADVVASDSIGPGQSTTVTVTLEAGEYVFYCSIGNHRAMGMETTVTVAA